MLRSRLNAKSNVSARVTFRPSSSESLCKLQETLNAARFPYRIALAFEAGNAPLATDSWELRWVVGGLVIEPHCNDLLK